MRIKLYQYNNEMPIIGIIKLDTKFQRILGDIGNSKTWDFPVIYQPMEGIFPEKAIYNADFKLLSNAIESAKILEKKGASAITTTCGFLIKYQKEISNSVNVPVFTSSLLQIPMIYQLLKKKNKIGILTANFKALTKEHLTASGIDNIPLIIKGMEDFDYFQSVFVRDRQGDFDKEKIKAEVVEAAIDLGHYSNELGAIVLECTNMSPYAHDIQKKVNLPLFDMYSLMQWIYAGLIKEKFNEIE
jgi:aspartate/glutamate racemase